LLCEDKSANLLFIDPTGFELEKTNFEYIANSHTTDFLLFVPVEYFCRFPKAKKSKSFLPGFSDYSTPDSSSLMKRYIDYLKDYFIPKLQGYHLAHFSILKKSKNHNTYGILYGKNQI
jgi:hypothetical protein